MNYIPHGIQSINSYPHEYFFLVNHKSGGNFGCTSALTRSGKFSVCAIESLSSIRIKHLAVKCFDNLLTKKYWTKLINNTGESTKMALGMLTTMCNKREAPIVEEKNRMSC